MVGSSGQDQICLCLICSLLVFLAPKDGLFDIIICSPGFSMINRRVAEEVFLYLIRLLEDLELDAVGAGLKPGQVPNRSFVL